MANSSALDVPGVTCTTTCLQSLQTATSANGQPHADALDDDDEQTSGIFVARVTGTRKLLGRTSADQSRRTGAAGPDAQGPNRFRWNGKVNGRRLKRGHLPAHLPGAQGAPGAEPVALNPVHRQPQRASERSAGDQALEPPAQHAGRGLDLLQRRRLVHAWRGRGGGARRASARRSRRSRGTGRRAGGSARRPRPRLARQRLAVEPALAGDDGARARGRARRSPACPGRRRRRRPARRRTPPTARRPGRPRRRSSARPRGSFQSRPARSRRRLASRRTVSESAPFCGPNTSAARSHGVRTSHSTTRRAPRRPPRPRSPPPRRPRRRSWRFRRPRRGPPGRRRPRPPRSARPSRSSTPPAGRARPRPPARARSPRRSRR